MRINNINNFSFKKAYFSNDVRTKIARYIFKEDKDTNNKLNDMMKEIDEKSNAENSDVKVSLYYNDIDGSGYIQGTVYTKKNLYLEEFPPAEADNKMLTDYFEAFAQTII